MSNVPESLARDMFHVNGRASLAMLCNDAMTIVTSYTEDLFYDATMFYNMVEGSEWVWSLRPTGTFLQGRNVYEADTLAHDTRSVVRFIVTRYGDDAWEFRKY